VTRVLIVPAAGRGSRLGSDLPKLLVPVNGRAMIDHIFDRYRETMSAFLLVVNPGVEAQIRKHCSARPERIEILRQDSPTGMLDAILIPTPPVRELSPREVWITWCDQVAVQGETVKRLAAEMEEAPFPALALPTVMMEEPYIHFVRDTGGEIVGVLHRREGDPMPGRGEADIGLFALSGEAYLEQLTRYVAGAPIGASTGERNFLPFIPWLAGRAEVRTVAATAAIEAVGINTPADLDRVARHLAG
jgi:bifunctional UDP-N-acetylglucosamine pyrophosphorylase/glucosamine-1-phosphate N-acetyltransferase